METESGKIYIRFDLQPDSMPFDKFNIILEGFAKAYPSARLTQEDGCWVVNIGGDNG